MWFCCLCLVCLLPSFLLLARLSFSFLSGGLLIRSLTITTTPSDGVVQITTVDELMEHFGCVINLYILFSCLLFWNVIFYSVIENIIYTTSELLSGDGLKQIVDGCLMLHMQTKADISVLTECPVTVSRSALKLIDCFLCVFKGCEKLEWWWRLCHHMHVCGLNSALEDHVHIQTKFFLSLCVCRCRKMSLLSLTTRSCLSSTTRSVEWGRERLDFRERVRDFTSQSVYALMFLCLFSISS